MTDRAAILLSCTKREAAIREQARVERRTVSGYVLKIALKSASFDETVLRAIGGASLSAVGGVQRGLLPEPRTTVLIRCAAAESKQIRAAARRRNSSISRFVLLCLRRVWRFKAQHGDVSLNWVLHYDES